MSKLSEFWDTLKGKLFSSGERIDDQKHTHFDTQASEGPMDAEAVGADTAERSTSFWSKFSLTGMFKYLPSFSRKENPFEELDSAISKTRLGGYSLYDQVFNKSAVKRAKGLKELLLKGTSFQDLQDLQEKALEDAAGAGAGAGAGAAAEIKAAVTPHGSQSDFFDVPMHATFVSKEPGVDGLVETTEGYRNAKIVSDDLAAIVKSYAETRIAYESAKLEEQKLGKVKLFADSIVGLIAKSSIKVLEKIVTSFAQEEKLPERSLSNSLSLQVKGIARNLLNNIQEFYTLHSDLVESKKAAAENVKLQKGYMDRAERVLDSALHSLTQVGVFVVFNSMVNKAKKGDVSDWPSTAAYLNTYLFSSDETSEKGLGLSEFVVAVDKEGVVLNITSMGDVSGNTIAKFDTFKFKEVDGLSDAEVRLRAIGVLNKYVSDKLAERSLSSSPVCKALQDTAGIKEGNETKVPFNLTQEIDRLSEVSGSISRASSNSSKQQSNRSLARLDRFVLGDDSFGHWHALAPLPGQFSDELGSGARPLTHGFDRRSASAAANHHRRSYSAALSGDEETSEYGDGTSPRSRAGSTS